MKTALIDQSNIVMIVRHASLPKDKKQDDYGAQLIFQEAVKLICDCVKRYNATHVIHAVEGRNNWRKTFYPEYKANRQIETDIYYPEIRQAHDWLQDFFANYTNHSVVGVDECEADDVIAVSVQENPDQEFVIISSDKDFTQLMRDGVTLYTPQQSKEREREEDPEFSLFLKCIRGDKSDNITSAYPRVYEKTLKAAWDESPQYKMKNIMETVVNEGEDKVHSYYDRNRTLIDLTQQPTEVREKIKEALANAGKEDGSYQYINLMKFLREIDLSEFSKDLERYSSVLSLK